MVTDYRVSLGDLNVKHPVYSKINSAASKYFEWSHTRVFIRRLQDWNHLTQDGKTKHEPGERSVQKLSIVWLHSLGLCADKKYTAKYIAGRFDSRSEGRN